LSVIAFFWNDLAEQDRIVSILDKFDTLTSSISEGLPREISHQLKRDTNTVRL
jgi:restriction endonuclease S subunit